MHLRTIDWPAPGFSWPYGDYLVEIPSLEAARRALGPRSREARDARSASFWTGPLAARRRLRIGMHDRGEEYLFASGAIHESDRPGHERHVPFHLKVVRRPELIIASGETFDATAAVELWPGLHFREELYVLVAADRLVVEPGAALEVRGNVFVLDCAHLELAGAGPSPGLPFAFDIRILGTNHPAFSRARRTRAERGGDGTDGKDGLPGTVPAIVPSVLGPIVQGSATPGANGSGGSNGERGSVGQNGGLAMLADLRFGALSGLSADRPVRVFAQAGAGLPGGDGGNGGRGGSGGDALAGPGRGGSGGDGGSGGHGGNGGLGGNIFVEAPREARSWFDFSALDSVGGAPGRGGSGGAGGRGGLALGRIASSGANGRDGPDGLPGRSRPAPSIHFIAASGADAAWPFSITHQDKDLDRGQQPAADLPQLLHLRADRNSQGFERFPVRDVDRSI